MSEPMRTCRYCRGPIQDELPSSYCSVGCYESAEAGNEKEEAPAETGAPDNWEIGKGLLGTTPENITLDTLGEMVGALTGDSILQGEHFSVWTPKMFRALNKGLIASVRLSVLRDAFNDYAAGRMSPGELINKISSQVRHV